jgi:hypothetical protein
MSYHRWSFSPNCVTETQASDVHLVDGKVYKCLIFNPRQTLITVRQLDPAVEEEARTPSMYGSPLLAALKLNFTS